MNTNTITSAAIGAQLERTARRIAAPVLAMAITSLLLLIQLAWELGHQLGHAVHARSEQLGRLHVAALGLEASSGAEHGQPAAEPAAEPVPAALPTPAPNTTSEAGPAHPITGTVRELRQRCRAAGIPSRQWKSARKAELQLLLAC